MLKQLMKKNKLIWNINRIVKSYQVERNYKKICEYYNRISITKNFNELLVDKGWHKFKKKDNIKIFYFGGDELQDWGGFLQALSSLYDVKYFTKHDGSYGQYSRGDSRNQNIDRLLELFKKNELEENWIPDILMMQSFGFNIDNTRLEEMKNRWGFKIINIGMDERLSYKLGIKNGNEMGISGLNPIIDLAFITTPECVDWYIKEGVPAVYFPLASDEEVYFPHKTANKKYDLGFIGRNYGIRQEIVQYLIKNGVNVKAYGPGWESGSLNVSENNDFYNSCKIVLGTANIGYSKKLMNPKLRDFEVPLSGTLYITNYTTELSNLFEEDREIILYRSKKDLLKKIKYYLQNDLERERIALNGYKKAINEHRYKLRLEKTFEKILLK